MSVSVFFFFSSRRRHTRLQGDWSSDVCSSDLQDFVTEPPGQHVAPWLPRLRAELGPDASDEDLLLAAFYDKSLLAPLKKPAPAYQFRTSPVTLSPPTVAQLIAMTVAGLAGVIRGITGFGGAMVLMPPLALLLGPQL